MGSSSMINTGSGGIDPSNARPFASYAGGQPQGSGDAIYQQSGAPSMGALRFLQRLLPGVVRAVICSVSVSYSATAGGYGLQSSFGMQGQVPGSRYGPEDTVNWSWSHSDSRRKIRSCSAT